MSAVLTANTTITCGPPPHGGRVTLTPRPNAKLSVRHAMVLRHDDVVHGAIRGCLIDPDAMHHTIKCTSVDTNPPGSNPIDLGSFSSKLTVGDLPVLMDTLKGKTNGLIGNAPQALLHAVEAQPKLTTR